MDQNAIKTKTNWNQTSQKQKKTHLRSRSLQPCGYVCFVKRMQPWLLSTHRLCVFFMLSKWPSIPCMIEKKILWCGYVCALSFQLCVLLCGVSRVAAFFIHAKCSSLRWVCDALWLFPNSHPCCVSKLMMPF